MHAGIQYRELLEGTGSKVIALGSKVSMKCVLSTTANRILSLSDDGPSDSEIFSLFDE